MGNFFDYLLWRGDLSFKTRTFNQIDSIILCQILYAKLDNLVSEKFSRKIRLSSLAEIYFTKNLQSLNLGVFINNGTSNILKLAGNSKRFKDIQLCGYVNHIDESTKTQFCAVTAILPTGEICVIYKGTDDTILGWEESFSLAYKMPIEGHLYAKQYLDEVAKKFSKKMYVFGHSKGGNLAVYAAVHTSKKNAQKIIAVFDNDGPGFLENEHESTLYKNILPKIHTIIPESSIVGPLLNRENKPQYIKSTGNTGIAQHDLTTWQIECSNFIFAERQSLTGEVSAKTVETWLSNLPQDKKEEFLSLFFDTLKKTGAKTLTELQDNWLKNSVDILKSVSKLDKETKTRIYDIFRVFFHSLQLNIPSLKDFLKNE